MTHADGYFAIGKTHTVCQDYVRHGSTLDGRAYVIVSDGCSSAPDADIGARLLVLAAEQYIRGRDPDCEDTPSFEVIANLAFDNAREIGVSTDCLDATLMLAIEKKNCIAVYMMGDGVVAARNRDGSCYRVLVSFGLGAPFYPSYLTNKDRLEGFHSLNGNLITRDNGFLGDKGTLETYEHPDFPFPLHKVTTLDTRSLPYDAPVVRFEKSEYDLVTLMTDGAMSFRKDFKAIPVEDVISQVIQVKVPAGEFMVRRARKFLGTFCPANGWFHDDDFGIGAIFVDEGPE